MIQNQYKSNMIHQVPSFFDSPTYNRIQFTSNDNPNDPYFGWKETLFWGADLQK